MGYSNVPGSSSMGIGTPGAHRHAMWGGAWFVDYDNGNTGDANTSLNNPDFPLKTIQAAVTASKRGDVIYIRERPIVAASDDPAYYSENIIIPLAKQGISLIGTGANRNQSWGTGIKGAAASAILTVRAPLVNIENLTFNRGSSTGGHIYAKSQYGSAVNQAWGLSIYNCRFRNANQITYGAIFLDNLWDVTIDSCFFNSNTGSIVCSASEDSMAALRIINNLFMPGYSDPTAASVDFYILDMVLTYNLLIDNNRFLGPVPALSAGTYKRYVYLNPTGAGGAVYGLMCNNIFADTGVAEYGTSASGCTSAVFPATVLFANNYSEGAVASEPLIKSVA